jgi:hypothetical protein
MADGDNTDQKLSVDDFAQRIKDKYPEYADLDNSDLAARVVRKYPSYADNVDLPSGFSLLHTTSGHPKLDSLYEQAGRANDVDPNLLLEQGRQETSFSPDVLYGRRGSSAGALGAGQFMPATAAKYGVTDRTDPIQSINGQARYMRKLLDQFGGDENLALAGYNGGEYKQALRNGQIPNVPETQNYVRNISAKLAASRANAPSLAQFLGQQPSPATLPGARPAPTTVAPTLPIATQAPAENAAPASEDDYQQYLKFTQDQGQTPISRDDFFKAAAQPTGSANTEVAPDTGYTEGGQQIDPSQITYRQPGEQQPTGAPTAPGAPGAPAQPAQPPAPDQMANVVTNQYAPQDIKFGIDLREKPADQTYSQFIKDASTYRISQATGVPYDFVKAYVDRQPMQYADKMGGGTTESNLEDLAKSNAQTGQAHQQLVPSQFIQKILDAYGQTKQAQGVSQDYKATLLKNNGNDDYLAQIFADQQAGLRTDANDEAKAYNAIKQQAGFPDQDYVSTHTKELNDLVSNVLGNYGSFRNLQKAKTEQQQQQLGSLAAERYLMPYAVAGNPALVAQAKRDLLTQDIDFNKTKMTDQQIAQMQQAGQTIGKENLLNRVGTQPGLELVRDIAAMGAGALRYTQPVLNWATGGNASAWLDRLSEGAGIAAQAANPEKLPNGQPNPNFSRVVAAAQGLGDFPGIIGSTVAAGGDPILGFAIHGALTNTNRPFGEMVMQSWKDGLTGAVFETPAILEGLTGPLIEKLATSVGLDTTAGAGQIISRLTNESLGAATIGSITYGQVKAQGGTSDEALDQALLMGILHFAMAGKGKRTTADPTEADIKTLEKLDNKFIRLPDNQGNPRDVLITKKEGGGITLTDVTGKVPDGVQQAIIGPRHIGVLSQHEDNLYKEKQGLLRPMTDAEYANYQRLFPNSTAAQEDIQVPKPGSGSRIDDIDAELRTVNDWRNQAKPPLVYPEAPEAPGVKGPRRFGAEPLGLTDQYQAPPTEETPGAPTPTPTGTATEPLGIAGQPIIPPTPPTETPPAAPTTPTGEPTTTPTGEPTTAAAPAEEPLGAEDAHKYLVANGVDPKQASKIVKSVKPDASRLRDPAALRDAARKAGINIPEPAAPTAAPTAAAEPTATAPGAEPIAGIKEPEEGALRKTNPRVQDVAYAINRDKHAEPIIRALTGDKRMSSTEIAKALNNAPLDQVQKALRKLHKAGIVDFNSDDTYRLSYEDYAHQLISERGRAELDSGKMPTPKATSDLAGQTFMHPQHGMVELTGRQTPTGSLEARRFNYGPKGEKVYRSKLPDANVPKTDAADYIANEPGRLEGVAKAKAATEEKAKAAAEEQANKDKAKANAKQVANALVEKHGRPGAIKELDKRIAAITGDNRLPLPDRTHEHAALSDERERLRREEVAQPTPKAETPTESPTSGTNPSGGTWTAETTEKDGVRKTVFSGFRADGRKTTLGGRVISWEQFKQEYRPHPDDVEDWETTGPHRGKPVEVNIRETREGVGERAGTGAAADVIIHFERPEGDKITPTAHASLPIHVPSEGEAEIAAEPAKPPTEEEVPPWAMGGPGTEEGGKTQPPVPQGVKSLSQWVRQKRDGQSGIRPVSRDSGEGRRLSDKETGSSGLKNQNAPFTAEQMAVMAWDAGYLRDLWPDRRDANGNQLWTAIEDDVASHKETGRGLHFSKDDFEKLYDNTDYAAAEEEYVRKRDNAPEAAGEYARRQAALIRSTKNFLQDPEAQKILDEIRDRIDNDEGVDYDPNGNLRFNESDPDVRRLRQAYDDKQLEHGLEPLATDAESGATHGDAIFQAYNEARQGVQPEGAGPDLENEPRADHERAETAPGAATTAAAPAAETPKAEEVKPEPAKEGEPATVGAGVGEVPGLFPGKPEPLTPEATREARRMKRDGKTDDAIAEKLGISVDQVKGLKELPIPGPHGMVNNYMIDRFGLEGAMPDAEKADRIKMVNQLLKAIGLGDHALPADADHAAFKTAFSAFRDKMAQEQFGKERSSYMTPEEWLDWIANHRDALPKDGKTADAFLDTIQAADAFITNQIIPFREGKFFPGWLKDVIAKYGTEEDPLPHDSIKGFKKSELYDSLLANGKPLKETNLDRIYQQARREIIERRELEDETGQRGPKQEDKQASRPDQEGSPEARAGKPEELKTTEETKPGKPTTTIAEQKAAAVEAEHEATRRADLIKKYHLDPEKDAAAIDDILSGKMDPKDLLSTPGQTFEAAAAERAAKPAEPSTQKPRIMARDIEGLDNSALHGLGAKNNDALGFLSEYPENFRGISYSEEKPTSITGITKGGKAQIEGVANAGLQLDFANDRTKTLYFKSEEARDNAIDAIYKFVDEATGQVEAKPAEPSAKVTEPPEVSKAEAPREEPAVTKPAEAAITTKKGTEFREGDRIATNRDVSGLPKGTYRFEGINDEGKVELENKAGDVHLLTPEQFKKIADSNAAERIEPETKAEETPFAPERIDRLIEPTDKATAKAKLTELQEKNPGKELALFRDKGGFTVADIGEIGKRETEEGLAKSSRKEAQSDLFRPPKGDRTITPGDINFNAAEHLPEPETPAEDRAHIENYNKEVDQLRQEQAGLADKKDSELLRDATFTKDPKSPMIEMNVPALELMHRLLRRLGGVEPDERFLGLQMLPADVADVTNALKLARDSVSKEHPEMADGLDRIIKTFEDNVHPEHGLPTGLVDENYPTLSEGTRQEERFHQAHEELLGGKISDKGRGLQAYKKAEANLRTVPSYRNISDAGMYKEIMNKAYRDDGHLDLGLTRREVAELQLAYEKHLRSEGVTAERVRQALGGISKQTEKAIQRYEQRSRTSESQGHLPGMESEGKGQVPTELRDRGETRGPGGGQGQAAYGEGRPQPSELQQGKVPETRPVQQKLSFSATRKILGKLDDALTSGKVMRSARSLENFVNKNLNELRHVDPEAADEVVKYATTTAQIQAQILAGANPTPEIAKALRDQNMSDLQDSVEIAGLAKPLKPGAEPPSEIMGQPTTFLRIGNVPYTVPKWLAKELKPVLEHPDDPNIVNKTLNRLNMFGATGLLEPIYHTANLVGGLIGGTPFIGQDILSRTIGNTPATKILTGIIHVAMTDPLKGDPAMLRDMAESGAFPSEFANKTFSKKLAAQLGIEHTWNPIRPFLTGPKGIDTRSRIVMWKIAETINPNASRYEKAEFVQKLGIYNRALESQLSRSLKGSQLAPFFTAGSQMLKNGVLGWLNKTPLPTEGLSPGWRMARRAQQQFSGGVLGMLGMWAAASYAYRGVMPWNDKDSRFLQIPLNPKDRNSPLAKMIWGDNDKTAYVGLGMFSPLVERGARALGISGAYDTAILGGSKEQMLESGATGTINSIAGPLTSSPVVRAASIAATGYEPSLMALRDREGQYGAQFFKPPDLPKTAGIGRHILEGGLDLNPALGDIMHSLGVNRDKKQELTKGEGLAFVKSALDIAFPRLLKTAVQREKARAAIRAQREAMRRQEAKEAR